MLTPKRVVASMIEMTRALRESQPLFTLFNSPSDQFVCIKNISFSSICAHHHLPFIGVASVGYFPNGKIAGLSKFVRIVQYMAAQPLTQESLGVLLVDYFVEKLSPLGICVKISANHTCVCARGVKTHGVETVTSIIRGDLGSRAEDNM